MPVVNGVAQGTSRSEHARVRQEGQPRQFLRRDVVAGMQNIGITAHDAARQCSDRDRQRITIRTDRSGYAQHLLDDLYAVRSPQYRWVMGGTHSDWQTRRDAAATSILDEHI